MYKVTLIGGTSVGKTCLHIRATKDSYPGLRPGPTVGAAYCTVTINSVKMGVWDTAGQERYGSLMPMYTRGAHAILLCFDYRDQMPIGRFMTNARSSDAKVFYVQTKVDLRFNPDQFQDYLKTQKIPADERVYLTSSLSGQGVADLFRDVAAHMTTIPKRTDSLAIRSIPEEEPARTGGCICKR